MTNLPTEIAHGEIFSQLTINLNSSIRKKTASRNISREFVGNVLIDWKIGFCDITTGKCLDEIDFI